MTSMYRPFAWRVFLLVASVIVICYLFTLITSTPLARMVPNLYEKNGVPSPQPVSKVESEVPKIMPVEKEQNEVPKAKPVDESEVAKAEPVKKLGPHINKGKGSFATIAMHPLRNSSIHAEDSYGCDHVNLPNLTFSCHRAIAVDLTMSLAQRRDKLYEHTRRQHVKCQTSVLVGHAGDGGWWVCTSGTYAWKSGSCLIYSFGINKDWSFDDTSSKKYGCQVNSFDPTIGLEDHKHSEHVMFYNTGLGAKNQVNEHGWKMRSLCTLFKELGHNSSIIDYVKFDIEFSEWPAIVSMLQEGCLSQVKQIAFEIHAWEDTAEYYMVYWQALQGLENEGFQRWYLKTRDWNCFKPTDNPNKRYCPQTDMAYINTRFLENP